MCIKKENVYNQTDENSKIISSLLKIIKKKEQYLNEK